MNYLGAAARYAGLFAPYAGILGYYGKRHYNRMGRPLLQFKYSRKSPKMRTAYGYGGTARRGATDLEGKKRGPMKHKDTEFAADNATVTGLLTHFPVIARGTDNDERIGSSIVCTGVLIRGWIRAGATQTTPANVKVSLVLDKKYEQTVSTIASIFENDAAPYQLPEMQFRNRFQTIWTATYQIVGDSDAYTSGAENANMIVDKFIPLRNVRITWLDTNTDGALDSMREKAFYMIYGSDIAADDTTAPRIYLKARLYFRDA